MPKNLDEKLQTPIDDVQENKPQAETGDFDISQPQQLQSNIITPRRAEEVVRQQLRDFQVMIGEDLNVTI